VEKGTSSKNSTSTSKKPSTPSEPVVSDSPTNDADFDVNQLLNIAHNMEGTVYKWGGSTPSGFDCSGFIHYAYNNAGKSMGRMSSTGYFDQSYYVRSPKKGDLVFFENTYQAGISHLGIYIGNNQFISAESDGVKVNSLDNPYWSKHYHGIKRLF
jgi:peptidoglycan endopeptidase LytE